jgi:hypothetical protein
LHGQVVSPQRVLPRHDPRLINRQNPVWVALPEI